MEEEDRIVSSPWRAIPIAVILTLAITAWMSFTTHASRSISLKEGMLPLGIFLPYVFLVFLINPALRLLGARAYLKAWELLLIFSVGYVSSSIGEMIGRAMAAMPALYYLATPENQWAEYCYSVVPPWLVVKAHGQELSWFYEGLPEAISIPWRVWVSPLFWWMSFFAAIGIGSISLGVIFRGQWMDQERLPFPIAQVPISLAEDMTQRSGLPGYMKGKLFWIGFGVPFFIVCWHIATYFHPGFPTIGIGVTNPILRFGRWFTYFFARINFFIVAFAYFTNLEILLSVWFFHVLALLEVGFLNRVGIATGGSEPGVHQQDIGGFIFFVLWSLWVSRRHLKGVFKTAFGGRSAADDTDEMLSYRMAVIGFLASLLYLIGWIHSMGMNLALAVVVSVFWFVFYVGLAKVLAMTGLIFLASPALGPTMVHLLPTTSLDVGTIAANTLAHYTTFQNAKGFNLPSAAHVARIAAPLKGKARTIGLAVTITFVVALVASALSTTYFGYQKGAWNFGSYMFNFGGPKTFDRMANQIKNIDIGDPYYRAKTAFVFFGFLFTALLTFMHYRFLWWPLHPIGFTIAMTYSVRTAVFSFFITWVCKALILKVGGISLYRRATPLFLGMIVGYAFSLIIALFVDYLFFPGQGHNLYWGD